MFLWPFIHVDIVSLGNISSGIHMETMELLGELRDKVKSVTITSTLSAIVSRRLPSAVVVFVLRAI